ncbi:MAG: hypothetical protein J5958_06530 [Clostridia bacterium]|nr:hypothetical protein [Clostridia bacterium]
MANTISAEAHKAYLNSLKSNKITVALPSERKTHESPVKDLALGAIKLIPVVGTVGAALNAYGSDVSLVKGIESLTGEDLSGLKKVAAVMDFVPSKLKAGAMGAVEGMTDFVAGIGAQAARQKDAAKWIYEHSWSQDLSGSQDVDEQLDNGTSGYRVASDLITGIGNVGFQVGIGLATGGMAQAGQISSAVASAIRWGSLFAQGAGSGTAEAVQKTGNVGWKENVAGLGSGAIEVLTEKISPFGGESPTSKFISAKITGKTVDETAKYFAKHAIAKSIFSDFAGEFFEESSSYVLNWGLQNKILKIDDSPFSWKDWAYEGVMGGIAGGLFSSVSSISSIRTAQKAGAKVYAEGEDAVKRKISEGKVELDAMRKAGMDQDPRFKEGFDIAHRAITELETNDKLTQKQKELYLGLAERAVMTAQLTEYVAHLAEFNAEQAKAGIVNTQALADSLNAVVREAGGESNFKAEDFLDKDSYANRVRAIAETFSQIMSPTVEVEAAKSIVDQSAPVFTGSKAQAQEISKLAVGDVLTYNIGDGAYATITKRGGTNKYAIAYASAKSIAEGKGVFTVAYDQTVEQVMEIAKAGFSGSDVDVMIKNAEQYAAEEEERRVQTEILREQGVDEETLRELGYIRGNETTATTVGQTTAQTTGKTTAQTAKSGQTQIAGQAAPGNAEQTEKPKPKRNTAQKKQQSNKKTETKKTGTKKTEAKTAKIEDLSDVEQRLVPDLGIDRSSFTREEWIEARKYVPNIDTLDGERKARILTLVRTGNAMKINKTYLEGLVRISAVYNIGMLFTDRMPANGFEVPTNNGAYVVINPGHLNTTYGHELFHTFAKGADGKTRADLVERIKKIVGAEAFDKAKAEYKKAYKAQFGTEISAELLDEEASASVVGNYLSNMTLLRKIAAKDAGLGRRLLGAIRNMKTRWSIAKAFAKENDSTAFAEYRKMTRIERLLMQELNARDAKQAGDTAYSAASAESDSDGNTLSYGQQNYFAKSKVRDANGRLLVVYHGTDADFTSFDMSKGRSNMDIQGAFFSPWELDASGYGKNVRAYYLNLTNPAPESVAYRALNRFKGQNDAGKKARQYLESLGYDGVNNGNEEYIAFHPKQAKYVSNFDPTESTDLRFSPATVSAKAIDLSDDSELTRLIGDKKGSSKYKVIQQYIMDNLTGEITLSDGTKATVDNNDARHMAHNSGNKRIAQISKIKEIVEKAELYADENSTKERKYTFFKYYRAFVKYNNESFPIYVNVGLTANKDGYKIYDITEHIRESAHLLKGVERLPEGSIALETDSLDSRIAQPSEKVNPSGEKPSFSPAEPQRRVVTRAQMPKPGITEKITNAKGQLNRRGLKNALDNASSAWESFKIVTVNAQQALENQLIRGGMTKRQAAAWSQLARTGRLHANNAIGYALADMTGEVRSDGLMKIITPFLAQKGEVYKAWDEDQQKFVDVTAKGGELAGKRYDDFSDYLAMLNAIDRAKVGKNPYSDMTVGQMQKIVAEYEKANPDFKAASEQFSQYNNVMLDILVQSGMVSQELADEFRKKYPHYIPMRTADSTPVGSGAIRGSENLEVNRGLRTAEESNHRVDDPIRNYITQVESRIKAAKLNMLAIEIYETADGVNVVRGQDSRATAKELREMEKKFLEDPLSMPDPTELFRKFQTGDNTRNEITFYKDGKMLTMAVSDRIYTGFTDLAGQHSAILDSNLAKLSKKINDTFKKLVTNWNPFFAVRNIARDLQDGLLQTQYGFFEFQQMYLKNAQMMASGKFNDLWVEFVANGGLESSLFSDKFATYTIGGKSGLEQAHGVVGQFQHIKNFNTLTEALPRFTEYCLTRKHGGSVQTALLNAADVTVNFGRGGTLTKILNSTVSPFLNPAVQGLDRVVRLFTENGLRNNKALASLLLKAFLLGILPMVLSNAMYGGDKEYEDMKDNVKENNYLFKIGNTWLKIPRGRVVSTISGLYNRSSKQATGQYVDWADYGKNVLDQITPAQNVARHIASPFIDVANNKTWYGSAIESQSLQNYAVKDRYDENTSRIAVWIGQFTSHFGYSPKKVHYLLDQYTGVVGDILLPATTPAGNRGVVAYNFTVDANTSSNLSERFYKVYNEAMYASNAGDEEAYYLKKRLDETKSAVAELYKEIKTINADSSLSNKEKVKQASAIRAMINQLYKTAVQDAKGYSANVKDAMAINDSYDVVQIDKKNAKQYGLTSSDAGKYAVTFGGQNVKLYGSESEATGYKTDASKKTIYAEANRLTYGSEYALKEYNTNVYEKAKTLNDLGISYDEYYNYYMTVRYYSGKDKKQKILAYLNGSGLSKSQTALMMYYSGYTAYKEDAKKAIKASKLSAERKKELLMEIAD